MKLGAQVNAILDLTNRDDIVPDPFLGSGLTLIAADKPDDAVSESNSMLAVSTS
jgi:hypothetical protein